MSAKISPVSKTISKLLKYSCFFTSNFTYYISIIMAIKAKVQPLGGNLLVEAVSEESTTASGIVLPDTVDKEKPQKGKIVALGTGKVSDDGSKIPFNVKVGDIVIFKKYSPDEITIDEKEYLIMTEEDVLAIVK